MFLRHGEEFVALGSIHRARWNPEERLLYLRVGPDSELVTLDGPEAEVARETLARLCPVLDDAGLDTDPDA